MEEHEAIARLKRGDMSALEPLVRQHQLKAIRAAYHVTRDVSAAEDIVQAAFLKAFEKIDQFDPNRPFAPWFFRIVLNDATKAATRQGRNTSLDGLLDRDEGSGTSAFGAPPLTPEERWEQAETADEIRTALAHLTAPQRAAIVARYYLELTEAEMSEALRRPPSTVKWRLHVARQRLRVLLRPVPND
jgi:RNA polymerase sigma-70 factor, ECF subfamily